MAGSNGMLLVFMLALILGNLVALAGGLSLMVAPKKIAKWLGVKAEHPLSVRRLLKPLERPRNSERVMLRYPRALGAAMLISGAFVLVKWGFFIGSLNVAAGGRLLLRLFPAMHWPAPVWEMFWVGAMVLIFLGAVLAVAVGALALLRVQTLKNFSALTGRWVSTRQAMKPVSRPYYGIDRLVGERPQVWGGVIALLSVYALVMILYFARVWVP